MRMAEVWTQARNQVREVSAIRAAVGRMRDALRVARNTVKGYAEGDIGKADEVVRRAIVAVSGGVKYLSQR